MVWSELDSASRTFWSFSLTLARVCQAVPPRWLESRSELARSRSQPESRKSSISGPSYPRDTIIPPLSLRAGRGSQVATLSSAGFALGLPLPIQRPCFGKTATDSFKKSEPKVIVRGTRQPVLCSRRGLNERRSAINGHIL